jgi:hypothetical protein
VLTLAELSRRSLDWTVVSGSPAQRLAALGKEAAAWRPAC